jgi:ABC-type iron transport system FetAB permease component
LHLFTLAVSAAILAGTWLIPRFIYHQVWLVLLFFYLLTLASLVAIKRLTQNRPSNFLAVYFSIMLARLFISIIFATAVILFDRSHLLNFSINFLLLYFVFLGFEIYGIITNLRQNADK